MIQRLAHLFAALCVLALFFGWGTRGEPHLFFTAFWPTAHLLYGTTAALLLFLVIVAPRPLDRLFHRLVSWRYRLFPPIAGIATVLIALFVFQGIPHVIDAAHFDWTARLLLKGTVSIPANDLYEFQDATFMVRDGGRFYSLFLPGFSLFLAPFTALGIGWFLTPLCTALAVWLTGRIAEHIFDAETSFLAMTLVTFSSFYLFMGGSFMTHPFNLLCVMVAVWFVFRDPTRTVNLIAGGTALAITLFIRPQNAVFVTAPLVLFLLIKRTNLKGLFLFILPFVLGGIGLLIYNFAMTGHPLVFPQDIYFSVIESRPFCHRLGLGTGCPDTEGEFLPPEGLTFEYAFWVAYTRLTLLLFNVTGHPYPFFFLAIAFLFAFRKTLLLFSFFAAFFIGYFFFYLPGNLFGPRYFSEVVMLLLIPAAYGLVESARRLPRRLVPLVAAFPITGVLFVSAFIMPELVKRYSDRFWVTDRSFEEAIAREDIRNSIVFVPESYHVMFLNTQKDPPLDDRGNLILKDLGRENHYAAAYYMEKEHFRNAYVIDYYPRQRNLTVVEELAEFRLNDIWIELEHKGRPLTGRPSYVTRVAAGVKLRNLPFSSLDEHLDFSGDKGLAILFGTRDKDSYYDFTVPILDPGEYEGTIEYLGISCGGSITLTVNGAPVTTFSTYDESESFAAVHFTTTLTAGTNRFVLTPEHGQTCLVLDYLRLKKKELPAADYPDYTPPEAKELNR